MKVTNNNRVVLGVDFGATFLKALLSDSTGQVHGRFVESSDSAKGPDVVLQRIVNLVNGAKTVAAAKALRMSGVGIGVCAPVDYRGRR